MTDILIFLHGVNTRERREKPEYAEPLCRQIKHVLATSGAASHVEPKMCALYWGDVMEDLEDELLTIYRQSPHWKYLGFRGIREKQLLQFTGDGALYLSRHAGSRVVERLHDKVLECLDSHASHENRLHLVTHSMGTVILFDILFSSRWDSTQIGGYARVEEIRKAFFGLDPHPQQGIRLASIHTMGSPLSIYSLMVTNGFADHAVGTPNAQAVPNVRDITPNLAKFLQRLPQQPLPWYNYLHPEDPIAYPLMDLLPKILQDPEQPAFDACNAVRVRDIRLPAPFTQMLNRVMERNHHEKPGVLNTLLQMGGDVIQKEQFIFRGGKAHGSYWTSHLVAEYIVQAMLNVAQVGV